MRGQKPKNPNKKTKTASPKKKEKKERTTLFLSSFLPNPAAEWNPTCLNNFIPGSITTSNSSATPQKEKGKNKETTTTTTTTKKTKPATLDQNTKFLHHKTPIFCHRL
jgi:hypothetical protein